MTATATEPNGFSSSTLDQEVAPRRPTRWLWAAAGPLAFGAVLGVAGTASEVARFAIAVPAVLAATALLTVPTLFVAMAYMQIGPNLTGFLRGCASSLESLGLVLAGLAPALLFLIGTGSEFHAMPLLFGATFIAIAAVVAVMGLFKRLVPPAETNPALAVFVPWAVVALGVGLHLYTKYIVLEVL